MNGNSRTNTYDKLLPRPIDAFENLCDLFLILVMVCNSPDKGLFLELG